MSCPFAVDSCCGETRKEVRILNLAPIAAASFFGAGLKKSAGEKRYSGKRVGNLNRS